MTSISAVVLFTECFAGMITAFNIPSCAFLLMRHGEKARCCSRLRKTMAVVWLFEFDTIALYLPKRQRQRQTKLDENLWIYFSVPNSPLLTRAFLRATRRPLPPHSGEY